FFKAYQVSVTLSPRGVPATNAASAGRAWLLVSESAMYMGASYSDQVFSKRNASAMTLPRLLLRRETWIWTPSPASNLKLSSAIQVWVEGSATVERAMSPRALWSKTKDLERCAGSRLRVAMLMCASGLLPPKTGHQAERVQRPLSVIVPSYWTASSSLAAASAAA